MRIWSGSFLSRMLIILLSHRRQGKKKRRQGETHIHFPLERKGRLSWHVDGKHLKYPRWFFCLPSSELLVCQTSAGWREDFHMNHLSFYLLIPKNDKQGCFFLVKEWKFCFLSRQSPQAQRQLPLRVITGRWGTWPLFPSSPGSSRQFWFREAQLWIQASPGCWFQLKSSCSPSSSRLKLKIQHVEKSKIVFWEAVTP